MGLPYTDPCNPQALLALFFLLLWVQLLLQLPPVHASLKVVHSQLHNIDLPHNVTRSLISRNPRNQTVLSSSLTSYCHVSLPYIMGFDNKRNRQRIQFARSDTVRCHQCRWLL